jgi:hypothetical protein
LLDEPSGGGHATADRKWLLDTYAECLRTVQNPSSRERPERIVALTTGGSFMVLCMVIPHLKKPIPNPPVERPVRGFSDCKEGGSFGALRSLGLVGVALRKDELNGWGGLVGVVLVVLAQENNFVVELAGGVL